MFSINYISNKALNYLIWFLITILFLFLGIINGDPATKIYFYSISAFLISFAIYNKSSTLSHGSLTIRMLVLSPMLQFAYITAFFLLGGSTQIYASSYNIDVGESPFRLIYSLLVLPVSVLAGTYILKILYIRFDFFNYKIRSLGYDRRFEILLTIAAFNLIYYRIGLMQLPILSTALSFLHLGLQLTPFLIGYFSQKYKLATKVFIAVYLVSSIIAFSEGSRGHLIIPPALFFLGYIQNVSFKKRIALVVISLLILPIILIISGAIEAVRGSIRSDQAYTTMTSDLAEMAKSASNYSTDDYSIPFKMGLSRPIVWSNLAVITMTPGSIPYRGFSDFVEEMEARLNFSFLNPQATEDEVTRDFGIGAANIYGFGLTVGYTVPFPVFADTWSRGGLIFTFSFGILMCLIFGYTEKGVMIMFSDNHYISLFLVTILSSVAFETFSIYGLIYTIKFLFLSTVVWIFLLKLYTNIYKIFYHAILYT